MLIRKVIGSLPLFLLALTVAAYPGSPSLQNAKPVVIAGKVLSPKPNSSITLGINLVGFEQKELTVPVDSAGSFLFRFSAYVPTDAWMIYGNNFLILFHPGDSLYIELNGAAETREALLETVKFKGTAATINQKAALFQGLYYASALYRQDYRKKEDKVKRSTPDEFVRHCDSLRKEGIKFQEAFVKREKPSQEVSTWSRLFIEQSYYSNLSFYPGNHRAALALKKSEWDVPVQYFDFLGKYYDIKQSLISGDAISAYIGNYTYKYILSRNQRDIAALNRSVSRHEEESMLLQNIVRYSKDALTREISLCFALNSLLEQSAVGTFEENRDLVDKHIKQPFLREPLLSKYQEKKKELDRGTHIVIDPLRSGVSFVDSVLQHNKGKVIYIDFWATWCGPCRQEFPYAKKMEEAFPDGVVFLYLCLESNKDAYRNLMQKYAHGGIHRFLDGDQSNMVRQKYDIKGLPHYMLIDKEGAFVPNSDIRPSEDKTESVIRELTKR
ncbi:TlpA family protein disulfide reductase [Dawidia soli]|uniref:TlpA family protein disulfide reductase n=1 Tax=Dawidia soli TaxID=2782352 RepID=A0AAP2DEI7_9BACT|nr:TlpA disulfide reductase family protein [Dawidia soli]MBT1689310.1 TlpA family protein disulfide reductase [Dawidia soli]